MEDKESLVWYRYQSYLIKRSIAPTIGGIAALFFAGYLNPVLNVIAKLPPLEFSSVSVGFFSGLILYIFSYTALILKRLSENPKDNYIITNKDRMSTLLPQAIIALGVIGLYLFPRYTFQNVMSLGIGFLLTMWIEYLMVVRWEKENQLLIYRGMPSVFTSTLTKSLRMTFMATDKEIKQLWRS